MGISQSTRLVRQRTAPQSGVPAEPSTRVTSCRCGPCAVVVCCAQARAAAVLEQGQGTRAQCSSKDTGTMYLACTQGRCSYQQEYSYRGGESAREGRRQSEGGRETRTEGEERERGRGKGRNEAGRDTRREKVRPRRESYRLRNEGKQKLGQTTQSRKKVGIFDYLSSAL